MAYTVGLPGGTRDFEFEAYVRLLEKKGVNVANTARAPDPTDKKRWLHAWQKKADAERFAAELRSETENARWQVYELPNGQHTVGPLGPIDIVVNRRSDGLSYGLSPISRKLISKCFPSATSAPSIFIAGAGQSDVDAHAPLWDHIAVILTGLSETQIKQLGGYRVVDPVAKQVLHEVPLS
jgi:hypothetical protein